MVDLNVDDVEVSLRLRAVGEDCRFWTAGNGAVGSRMMRRRSGVLVPRFCWGWGWGQLGLRLAVSSSGGRAGRASPSGELIWMAASGRCVLVCIKHASALTRISAELYGLLAFSQTMYVALSIRTLFPGTPNSLARCLSGAWRAPGLGAWPPPPLAQPLLSGACLPLGGVVPHPCRCRGWRAHAAVPLHTGPPPGVRSVGRYPLTIGRIPRITPLGLAAAPPTRHHSLT